MVAVAIGVSDAEDLPYLAGAVNCAQGFHEWAGASGYQSTLVTDEHKPVTVERLREELDAILKDKRPIHRFLIYFAGHGLLREIEQGWWLLSDWKREGRVVAYELMRRRLATFGVRQIAIFSDACRSLPRSIAELDLEERGVLSPGSTPGQPEVDKFIATQDGKATYAVPAPGQNGDLCVFSGVLLEALWGLHEAAFSKLVAGSITSSSLGLFLKKEVPLVARRYGLPLDPTVVPAFPETDSVYFAGAIPVRKTPPFIWPEPAAPAVVIGGLVTIAPGAPPKAAAPAPKSLLARLREQLLPGHFETGSGFALEGGEIRRLWTPPSVRAETHRGPGWWRLWDSDAPFRLTRPAPVLIELEDGHFAAVAALPDFVAGLLVDERGTSAVVYRSVLSNIGAKGAEHALDAMERGGLRADAVSDLAAEIRMEKHVDPMLGVFAAYLYESIGDLSSIRRMAYFYVDNGQPIPYDIALLGQIPVQRKAEGLIASVPAVPVSSPRSPKEVNLAWTFQATPPAAGIVGGDWPWLRQGWAFLEEVGESQRDLVDRRLLPFRRRLLPSRFPTFANEHGARLASELELQPRDPSPA